MYSESSQKANYFGRKHHLNCLTGFWMRLRSTELNEVNLVVTQQVPSVFSVTNRNSRKP